LAVLTALAYNIIVLRGMTPYSSAKFDDLQRKVNAHQRTRSHFPQE